VWGCWNYGNGSVKRSTGFLIVEVTEWIEQKLLAKLYM
jgi:hypothetical protein